MTTHYVCGFLFHANQGVDSSVVLIRNKRPDWQIGLLNGIGGKIQEGESPIKAIVREFEKAASVEEDQQPNWQHFATFQVRSTGVSIHFFRAFDRTAHDFARTTTDEIISRRTVSELMDMHYQGVVPDLWWLIPTALGSYLLHPVNVEIRV